MVYDAKTFELLHKPTKIGLKHYREMLEHEADMILWRNEHKIKAFLLKIKEMFADIFC